MDPQARRPAGDRCVFGALGWRAEGKEMNTVSNVVAAPASVASRYTQLAMSAMLGLFVIGFVGFSHLDVVHNAGHDYRHSMAFPCH